ncbi:hypothetical protein F5050DRAFT_1578364 [Lentinula boryana]|uniref:Autophagy-related protein 101 n=1 Tax=Lentinula boryana TaxID=40481 RepID=A0ABQ8Q3P6_9AGAR|nr:hypothetical protein F5050DRAFT_1578364 [Lentinula boryana]
MNTYPTITIDLVGFLLFQVFIKTNGYSRYLIQTQVDRHTIKDVLRAILDAILFHRLFGLVKLKTREVLGVTMIIMMFMQPGISDSDMEQLVLEEKVDLFWKEIEGGMSKRGQVFSFSEKRPKKSWFQVYVGEEDVPWEQWLVFANAYLLIFVSPLI